MLAYHVRNLLHLKTFFLNLKHLRFHNCSVENCKTTQLLHLLFAKGTKMH